MYTTYERPVRTSQWKENAPVSLSKGSTHCVLCAVRTECWHIAHLRQQCHNSKSVIFQEKRLKVLKCY